MSTDNVKTLIAHYLPLKEKVILSDNPNDFKNDDSNLVLKYAVRFDRPNLIKFAMKNHANNFDVAMAEAARAGNLERVQYFVNYGAKYWLFAIEKAARGGHRQIINFLSNQYLQNEQFPPLRYYELIIQPVNSAMEGAARTGRRDLVEHYIAMGANQLNSGLAFAARGGHLELVEYFVDRGANYWDWGMKQAARGNHVELVHYFIDRGAKYWDWAIQASARAGNMELTLFFIEKGARNWNKGLVEAARKGSQELVDLFIDRGARDWYQARNQARLGGHVHLVKFFNERIEKDLTN